MPQPQLVFSCSMDNELKTALEANDILDINEIRRDIASATSGGRSVFDKVTGPQFGIAEQDILMAVDVDIEAQIQFVTYIPTCLTGGILTVGYT